MKCLGFVSPGLRSIVLTKAKGGVQISCWQPASVPLLLRRKSALPLHDVPLKLVMPLNTIAMAIAQVGEPSAKPRVPAHEKANARSPLLIISRQTTGLNQAASQIGRQKSPTAEMGEQRVHREQRRIPPSENVSQGENDTAAANSSDISVGCIA